MRSWLERNFKTIIISTFLIPIIIVAIVSISHVTQWYEITNPPTWALYLSVGIEVAALSALSALTIRMGSKVYFPFLVVTLLQLIGNIYFSYSYIDVNSNNFKSWVELSSPLMEMIGTEPTDLISHKRILAFFSGGMLPLISLSFLHMLVKYNEKEDKREEKITPTIDEFFNSKPLEQYTEDEEPTEEEKFDDLFLEDGRDDLVDEEIIETPNIPIPQNYNSFDEDTYFDEPIRLTEEQLDMLERRLNNFDPNIYPDDEDQGDDYPPDFDEDHEESKEDTSNVHNRSEGRIKQSPISKHTYGG